MFKIPANGASLGPNSGLVAFDGCELLLQSSCWNHGAHHVSQLAAWFGAVLTDGGQRPGSVPDLRLWLITDMARSRSQGALLHLSYESLLTFSDARHGKRLKGWSHPVNHCSWFGTLFNNATSFVTFSLKGGHAESKCLQHSLKRHLILNRKGILNRTKILQLCRVAHIASSAETW